jgi:hypothetical protein
MKLNGWQRLWAVVTIIVGAVTAVFGWESQPTPEKLKHSAKLYSEIDEKHRSHILYTKIDPAKESYFILDAANVSDAVLVDMPNAHVLVFRSKLPESEKVEVSQAYWRAVEDAASRNLLVHWTRLAGGVGAFATLLYFLGLAIAWIRNGFSEAKKL